MAKPPKIDRKSLKQPDEFVTKGRSFLDVLIDNRKVLGVIGGVFVALSAVYYGYGWWNENKLNESWNAYMKVVKIEEKDRWKALESFYNDSSNLRPRYLAAIDLADHYFEEKKKAVLANNKGASEGENLAVVWYQKALEFGGLVPMERQLVLLNLGQSFELDGKIDEAQQNYEKASQIKGEVTGLALLNLGRSWEMKGEMEKAKENYKKVATDFAGTEYARMAKNYERALDSPLIKDILGK